MLLPVQGETVETSAVFCPVLFKIQKKGCFSTFFLQSVFLICDQDFTHLIYSFKCYMYVFTKCRWISR